MMDKLRAAQERHNALLTPEQRAAEEELRAAQATANEALAQESDVRFIKLILLHALHFDSVYAAMKTIFERSPFGGLGEQHYAVFWEKFCEYCDHHGCAPVYRHPRNPMYSAMLLISIGQALITPNWLVAPVSLVVFVLLFALRFEKEEAMMLEQFGEQYAAYVRRTRRLVPGIW
jgi:hypothetical protein